MEGACKPRLGFLGLGWIGRNRLEAVVNAQHAEVVGLSDADAKALSAAHLVAPNATCVQTIDELLALSLDGVVIATPSAQHARQTEQALARGLAVYCQKPLSRTGDEAAALIELARRQDRLLGVDLCYRHLDATSAVRVCLAEGALGSVYAADLTFHNAYGPDKPWFYDPRLSGGGCLMDLGIHLLDLLAWVLSESRYEVNAAALFAQGQALNSKSQVEDFATARLTLGGRVAVNLACSWRASVGRDAAIEMHLYGTKGGATLTNVNGSFYDFRALLHKGTQTHSLVEPPDAWGGRAINLWVRKLSQDRRFDPRCESLLTSSRAIDDVYRWCRRSTAISSDKRGATPSSLS